MAPLTILPPPFTYSALATWTPCLTSIDIHVSVSGLYTGRFQVDTKKKAFSLPGNQQVQVFVQHQLFIEDPPSDSTENCNQSFSALLT